MDVNRFYAVFAVILALTSAMIGLWIREGVMVLFSLFAVIFSIVPILLESKGISKYALITSSFVLICTILAATLLSYETIVENGTVTADQWVYLCAVIHTVPLIPLVMMFYFATAPVFKASYNWIFVSGLSWILGLGILGMGYAVTYLIQRHDIDSGILTNTNIVISLITGLVTMIILSLILLGIFKRKRYLITENGLEVGP